MRDNVVFLRNDLKSQVRRHAVLTVAETLYRIQGPRRWWCPWRSTTPMDFIYRARPIVDGLEREGLIRESWD